jgi:hypothetical protein
MPFRGDDTDELDRREWPEPDSAGEDDWAADTVPCPFCKRLVYDNAERCPHCGNYLFHDGASASRKPWWVLGGVLVCLAIVGYWISRG